MTREEANLKYKERIKKSLQGAFIFNDRFIDKIYDDFESRTCLYCKHFSDEILIPISHGNGLCYHERKLENPVFDDESCKFWEPKQ